MDHATVGNRTNDTATPTPMRDELGAHVSTAGGVQRAPERAAALDAAAMQVFTKQPSRWAEPACGPEVVAAFREQRGVHGVIVAASHDSYLINLASAKEAVRARSLYALEDEASRGDAALRFTGEQRVYANLLLTIGVVMP